VAFDAQAFAAARNLPVIFLCENNGWSEMTPISLTVRLKDLASRGEGLGIESHVVDGGDPFAVRDAVAAAAATCRRGEGPVLLECKTVRLKGHYNKDIEHYRPEADIAAAAAADPIARLRQTALSNGQLSQEQITSIDQRASALIEEATDTMRKMPTPDPATALDHLYGRVVAPTGYDKEYSQKDVTYQRAINQALRDELETRPDLLVYGEDVGAEYSALRGVCRSSLALSESSTRPFLRPRFWAQQ
jgi:2-oxoisovalerate dehydrogenase E1 component